MTYSLNEPRTRLLNKCSSGCVRRDMMQCGQAQIKDKVTGQGEVAEHD